MIDELLRCCAEEGASDIHLVPGLPPHLRRHGVLAPLAGKAEMDAGMTRAITVELMRRMGLAGDEPEDAVSATGSVDGAITSEGGVRFRFNCFRQQGGFAVAIRRLEERFRDLRELGLPEGLYSLCDLRDGLVIVAGATGAGKTTTLAALLHHVNRNRNGHIITIEDPVEYIHKPLNCVVSQRQVGADAPSFNDALVASLRQDPDFLLVGEIRDLETIRTAITAAETGHLVFTSLHAGDCIGSIERLVSVFPADEQEGIRKQLSLVLRGVVAQHLLPAAEGVSRVVASEVLLVNPAVANLIATGKSAQIYSAIELGTSAGMQTLEQDLARLWVAGAISEGGALSKTKNVAAVRDRAANLRRGRTTVRNREGSVV